MDAYGNEKVRHRCNWRILQPEMSLTA